MHDPSAGLGLTVKAVRFCLNQFALTGLVGPVRPNPISLTILFVHGPDSGQLMVESHAILTGKSSIELDFESGPQNS